MKKPTAVLVLFLLAATPGVAATRQTTPAGQFIKKAVRKVRVFFGIHTTGDQLIPPLPAPCDPAQGNCP